MRVFSEEHKKKLSDRAKARMANPEFKARQMQSRAEAFAKPEVKERMSQGQKHRFSDPANAEANAALQEKRKQAMQRPEVREKISEARKREFSDPERRTAMSEKLKEVTNTPEYRQKCSETRKATHSKPEVKENLSKAQKKRFENPEERQRTSEATKAAMPAIMQTEKYRIALAIGLSKARAKHGPTDIEVIVEALLQTLELEYETQKHVGGWVADFYVTSYNLIIECDGDYWHSSEKIKARDKKKDGYLNDKGYQVIRLTGSEIHAKKFDSLLSILNIQ